MRCIVESRCIESKSVKIIPKTKKSIVSVIVPMFQMIYYFIIRWCIKCVVFVIVKMLRPPIIYLFKSRKMQHSG